MKLLYVIERVEFVFRNPCDGYVRSHARTIRTYWDKDEAIAKLKDLAEKPPFAFPTLHEYNEERETTIIEERGAYRYEYRIVEVSPE